MATKVIRVGEVAERIKFWRKRAGFLGFELAGKCGVAPSTYSCWEHGHSEPPHRKLGLLVVACGIDMRTFWGPMRKSKRADSQHTKVGW